MEDNLAAGDLQLEVYGRYKGLCIIIHSQAGEGRGAQDVKNLHQIQVHEGKVCQGDHLLEGSEKPSMQPMMQKRRGCPMLEAEKQRPKGTKTNVLQD